MGRDEILGKSVYDIAEEPEARMYDEHDQALVIQRGREQYRGRVKTRRMGMRDVIFLKSLYTDPDGKPAGIIGTITDITDGAPGQQSPSRISNSDHPGGNAAGTLPDAQTLLDSILQSPSDLAILSVDTDLRVATCNNNFRSLLQDMYGSVIDVGDPFLPSISHPEDARKIRDVLQRCLRGGVIRQVDAFGYEPSRTFLEYYTNPILSSNGQILGVTIVLLDITDRQDAENALRESEGRYRSLVENLGEGIAIIDGDLRFIFANPATYDIFGVSPGTLIGRDLSDFITQPSQSEPEAQDLLGPPDARSSRELHIRRPDGHDRVLNLTATPLRTSAGKYSGSLVIFLDMTHRLEMEHSLRRSEAIYRRAIDLASGVPYEHRFGQDDRSGEFVFIGDAIERITGVPREELTRDRLMAMVEKEVVSVPRYADDPAEYHRAYREGKLDAFNADIRIRRPDGQVRWLSDHAVPICDENTLEIIGSVGILVDITNRKRSEEKQRALETQVQNAQRLESLGILAGGVAHDFNNLLVAIMGNADLALMDAPDDSSLGESLGEIKKAALRASELSKQMLAYSGKGHFIVEPVNLNALVEDMRQLLSASTSKKISLDFRFGNNLQTIEGDPTQLRQIVMNLILNASEAIGEHAGRITVRTGVVTASREDLITAHLNEDFTPGRYVFLEVADDGEGMDEQTRARAFDPFFTTRFTGRGLGLAAVLGIARGHQAAIKLDSDIGKGTTVTVLFPAGDSDASMASMENISAEMEAWQPEGTILVVDDEEPVRNVTRLMLQRAGFDVLTASNGQEAVELYRSRLGEISLVLLDMSMPVMDGQETFQELRNISGEIPAILCSGYTEQDAIFHFRDSGLAGFLQKPFDQDTLIHAIRKILA